MAGSAAGAAAANLPPKPDFSGFAFLTGTWSCANTDPRGARAYSLMWGRDATGYWFIGRRSIPAAYGEPATSDVNMITYDFDAKHFVELQSGSFGQYDYSTSAGFIGAKAVLVSVPFSRQPGAPGTTDVTVVKRSPTRFSLSGGSTIKGVRTVMWSGTCTKNTTGT